MKLNAPLPGSLSAQILLDDAPRDVGPRRTPRVSAGLACENLSKIASMRRGDSLPASENSMVRGRLSDVAASEQAKRTWQAPTERHP